MSTVSEFPPPTTVKGRASIADLYRPGARCGIYLLHFENGEMYVGQSEDVTRRYVQHRKAHSDIDRISFRRVPRSRLGDEECALIRLLEQQGFALRNIALASIPKGESDFDLVMPLEDQDKWLNDPGYVDAGGTRAVNDDLRRKYHARFQRFMGLPKAREKLDLLRRYVQNCVPAYLRSELAFWACSCLPGYSAPGVVVYSRINIHWQEVFTIAGERGRFFVSLHLARSPLEDAFGPSLNGLRSTHPMVRVEEHLYKPGGGDQVCLVCNGLDSTLELLDDPAVLSAARLFNLRLMKKGPSIYSKYHCLDLADILVGDGTAISYGKGEDHDS